MHPRLVSASYKTALYFRFDGAAVDATLQWLLEVLELLGALMLQWLLLELVPNQLLSKLLDWHPELVVVTCAPLELQ